LLSDLAKNALITLRDLYTARYFYDPRKGPRYRGAYQTYSEASTALPKGELHGFEDESTPEYYEKHLLAFNPGDYPVLFWLQKSLQAGDTIFDFGGGLAQCFYAYQEMMPFPAGVQWLVCDMESLIRRGRDLAIKRQAENLGFTTNRQEASGTTFFLTNGVLQYVPEDLSEILNNLAELPQHIFVNRVPMYDGKQYYTIQSSAHSFSPYKVFNLREFKERIQRLGYDLRGEWNLPRSLHVQFHPELYVQNYRGLYFRLKN
jgi:putative methyltransferase (TIGR04325 family)